MALQRITAGQIIEAAEEIFAKKGLDKTTIREVAKSAGVGVGTIYEYFADKHSLLFAIPALRIQEIIDGLKDSLNGIRGGFNKLRKFSHFLLGYYEKNQNFAHLIYLVIMPYEGWNDSPAYQLAKSVSDVFKEVIIEGQEEGLFRTDIDVRLARSAYLGAIERLTISWLLSRKSVSLNSMADDLTDLFIGGLSNPNGIRSITQCPFLRRQKLGGGRVLKTRSQKASSPSNNSNHTK